MGTEPLSNTRHNPMVLRSRDRHWIECGCGWLSAVYRAQVGAVVEHAEHVRQAKRVADGN